MENCPFKGTKTCAVLNMPDCAACPVSRGESPEKIENTVNRFLAAADAEEIASLFERDDCCLCRETPDKKTGYVITDLGHLAEKKGEEDRLAAFLTKRGEAFDMLVPLQFACCAGCRKRLWWKRNITGVLTGGLLLLAAAPISFEKSAEALRRVSPLMPVILVLAAGAAGYAAGRILKKTLGKKWNEKTVMNPLEHPVAKKLLAGGWQTAAEKKEQELFFSRKTVDRGLGTAPSKAYFSEKTDNTFAPEVDNGANN